MAQNRSHAVMAQRSQTEMFAQEGEQFPGQAKLDDFPTQPWGTRALVLNLIARRLIKQTNVIWEPAANRGYMVRPLREFFNHVIATDVYDYGFGYDVHDFLSKDTRFECDWVITNPPFALAEEFFHKALSVAKWGIAFVLRPGFLEGEGRYERIFVPRRPNLALQFVERIPMVRGRCEKIAGTASQYLWVIWLVREPAKDTIFDWIAPCRKQLERDGDYNVQPEERAEP